MKAFSARSQLGKWFLAVFLVVASISAPVFGTEAVASTQSYTEMKSGINRVLTNQKMRSAVSSVVVRKASNGEIVYQYQGDRGVTPASTTKLLTVTAALETLGENYRFRTDVLTNGTIQNGVLNGNLYIRGTGDPTLLEADLLQFAKTLRQLGVKEVTGHLVADDTWFDEKRLSPGIHRADETHYYAAQISGLTLSPNKDYDAGTTIVQAKPTRNGRAAAVTLTPHTNIVSVVNRSRTVPKGQANTLKIERKYGTNTIVITGNVPVGSSGKRQWVTVSNPTAYTADVFKRSLSKQGIYMANTSKVTRGKTPASAQVLATKESMQLYYLLMPFMKLSNNSHAEILAKTMGREVYNEGSWDAGLRVIREFAQREGINMKGLYLEDASGMSHSNKISSATLTELLYKVQSKPWYPAFKRSLPIAGVNDRILGGTLRNRLTSSPAKGNVLAKTGTLNRVDALSGYATARNGELLTFSILTQGAKQSARPDIDQIVRVIANSTGK